MTGIIYIFGPSCSGKSTLCETLQKRLGDLWTYVDRDQLIEEGQCIEADADKALEERILAVRNKLIIDAQIPWREKQKGEVYCLLLPPLEILLERDALRTKRLERPERRAFDARNYVIETHSALKALSREKFDICVDSSLLSVEETVLKILQFLEK